MTLTVADVEGLSTSTQLNVEVTEVEVPNAVPEITGFTPSVNSLELEEGGLASVELNASDDSPGDLIYTGSVTPLGVVAVTNVGNNYTIEALGAGTATVTLTVADVEGLSTSTELSVEVGPGTIESEGETSELLTVSI